MSPRFVFKIIRENLRKSAAKRKSVAKPHDEINNHYHQDRIAKRLGTPQQTISGHLAKMATLPNPLNTDLSSGFTVSQVAEKKNTWSDIQVCDNPETIGIGIMQLGEI